MVDNLNYTPPAPGTSGPGYAGDINELADKVNQSVSGVSLASYRGLQFPDGLTDFTAALVNIIENELGDEGGTILLPRGPGSYLIDLDAIDLTDRRSIVFKGEGAPTGGAQGPSCLEFPGTTGDRCIDARRGAGIVFDGVDVRATGAGFDGTVIDFSGDGTADTAQCSIEKSNVSGPADALLVNLARAIECDMVHVHFFGGDRALDGGSEYSVQNGVQRCQFKDQTTVPIRNPLNNWLLQRCVAEPLSGGDAGFVYADEHIYELNVINFWTGDVAADAGTWFEFTSGINVLAMLGGRISTGDTAISMSGVGTIFGAVITGIMFYDLATALDFSGLTGGSEVQRMLYDFNYFEDVADELNAGSIVPVSSRIRDGSALTEYGSMKVTQELFAEYFLDLKKTDDASVGTPAANHGRPYLRDNGAGKMQYVVKFPSGAAQVLATEP